MLREFEPLPVPPVNEPERDQPSPRERSDDKPASPRRKEPEKQERRTGRRR